MQVYNPETNQVAMDWLKMPFLSGRHDNKIKRMQSGTLHIASSLFPIFHKAFSMRKYLDQIWLPQKGSFVKNEK